MEIILLISLLISFLVTVLVLPYWIRKAKQLGLLWEDMNKYKTPKNVASSGGVVVVMAFIIGVLYYIATRTFFSREASVNLEIFALLSVILILALTGVIDDLFGWKGGGLSRKWRIVLAFIASIPLVVINAGTSSMNFPFLGEINIGFLYPLILIPLGIAGASITYNFLAGFNGLEAGQGILILTFLSFVAYKNNSPWLALIGLIMVAALFGFYFYNKYPAKVFPGDSLTWSIGALIAIMAILGNFEKVAVFVFIPYITEFCLKELRGKGKKYSFAKPNPDGSLEMPYKKIYGLTHLSLFILKKFKTKVYEKDVVYFIFIIQIIFILFGLLIW